MTRVRFGHRTKDIFCGVCVKEATEDYVCVFTYQISICPMWRASESVYIQLMTNYRILNYYRFTDGNCIY